MVFRTLFFFFQAEDGIRDRDVTGVQTCALPICSDDYVYLYSSMTTLDVRTTLQCGEQVQITGRYDVYFGVRTEVQDRKSTRLNSSHITISYAVFCLKKKKIHTISHLLKINQFEKNR